MTEVAEQPVTVIALGVITAIILGTAFIKTGKPALLVALLVSIAVFAGLFALERLIQTDREQIRDTLSQVASAVKRNEVDVAISHIHPDLERLARRAAAELSAYRFSSVKITQFREVSVDAKRPIAEARFIARADGNASRFGNFRVVRFVIVKLKKHEEQWKISDYEHRDFAEGFRRRDGGP